MVMRADVAAAAIDAVLRADAAPRPLIYLTPRGKPLTQLRVKELVHGRESSSSAAASRGWMSG